MRGSAWSPPSQGPAPPSIMQEPRKHVCTEPRIRTICSWHAPPPRPPWPEPRFGNAVESSFVQDMRMDRIDDMLTREFKRTASAGELCRDSARSAPMTWTTEDGRTASISCWPGTLWGEAPSSIRLSIPRRPISGKITEFINRLCLEIQHAPPASITLRRP